MGLVLAIQEQVRQEFGLGPWEKYFYRFEHGDPCPSCKRYYGLLDAIPLRMSRDAFTTSGGIT